MSYFPPGGGAGGLVLVGEQTIAGAAADRFQFAGLNGDADGVYELFWWMEGRTGAADRLQLYPNNLTANQTTTWTFTNGTPASPNSLNEQNRLLTASGMQRPQGWGKMTIWAKTGTFRSFVAEAGEGDLAAGGNYNRWYSQGMWRDSVTNITSLHLLTILNTGFATPGWGIGSRAQLWKRPF